ncbi:MAG: hypothetical protein AB7E55_03230 [Pigmentiphaga sp.]
MAIDESLSDDGSTATIRLSNGNPTSISIDGTFDATVTFERQIGGGAAWLPVMTFHGPATVLTRLADVSAGSALYRVTVSDYDSGEVEIEVDEVLPDTDVVRRVNGQTGDVTLDASDVGAATQADIDARLSDAQRQAIDALVSPTEDFDNLTEATTAVKAIIDALQAPDA